MYYAFIVLSIFQFFCVYFSRYRRVFQKKSSRWSVTPCKTLKEYAYIPQVIEKIVMKRLADEIGMNQRMIPEIDDTRRVSAHLAPVPPPPTQQIVESQRSRFTDESSNRTNDDMDRTIDYWAEYILLSLQNNYYFYDSWFSQFLCSSLLPIFFLSSKTTKIASLNKI